MRIVQEIIPDANKAAKRAFGIETLADIRKPVPVFVMEIAWKALLRSVYCSCQVTDPERISISIWIVPYKLQFREIGSISRNRKSYGNESMILTK